MKLRQRTLEADHVRLYLFLLEPASVHQGTVPLQGKRFLVQKLSEEVEEKLNVEFFKDRTNAPLQTR